MGDLLLLLLTELSMGLFQSFLVAFLKTFLIALGFTLFKSFSLTLLVVLSLTLGMSIFTGSGAGLLYFLESTTHSFCGGSGGRGGINVRLNCGLSRFPRHCWHDPRAPVVVLIR